MSTEPTQWTPMASREAATTTTPECLNCGNRVTRQFARVFGDNRDDVHACPDCSTYREMKTADFIPEDRR
ncbi:hypothetical protein ACFQMM_06620 [Saliphagus sp. GCM10025308]|uniref:Small CPxCG-related zinc finger protein n=1 Tax=Natronosalvus rutilus TaxID=2953753 RepID=A0A9E7SWR1_9EURY|nr:MULTISPECIES: hypothetical protein [Natronosalvus]USZ71927.1 hypothetical protein NGM15_01065 [Natronosalvus halobius]UTF55347.1 hypothetical protein NGM29_08895 [Natronosalvus rutilus]